jgi:HEAT repeat protein
VNQRANSAYKALPLLLLVAILGLCDRASAAQVITNKELNEMISSGVAMDVILKLLEPPITPNEKTQAPNCRFDDSPEAMIAIQEAGKKGTWPAEDIKKIQIKVSELSKKDQKFLKMMVDRARNVFENADPGEYDSMMRELTREGKRVLPYLMGAIEDERERVRAGIVDALGRQNQKDEATVRSISLMLTDRSKPVRLQAAKTIVALADEQTAKELIGRLNSRVEKLDGVATALGYLGNNAAIEPLTKLLRNSSDSDTRICAAFALGELRANTKDASAALLEAVLDEHDDKLRETAANALAGKLRDKRTPAYIVSAFRRYRQGREDIMKNLRYLKDLGALEFLIEQLEQNDDPKIKKVAHQTLVELTGNEAHDAEEWRGIRNVLQVRPDWAPSTSDAPRVPDAKREREGVKTGDDTIPTSGR